MSGIAAAAAAAAGTQRVAGGIDYSATHHDWTVDFVFRFRRAVLADLVTEFLSTWRGDWTRSNDGLVRYGAADTRNPPDNSHIRVLLGRPWSFISNTIHRPVRFLIPLAVGFGVTLREFVTKIHRRFPSIYTTHTEEFHIEDRWASVTFPAEEEADNDTDDESNGEQQLPWASEAERDQIRPPNRAGAMWEEYNRALMRDRGEDAQTTAEAVPVFHETDNPAGTRVPLGESFTIGEFLHLGDFYIEKKLILESFEDGADDGCMLMGGNKLYPVTVNKEGEGPTRVGQVYCMTEVIQLLEFSAQDGGNPRNAQDIFRAPIRTIRVMTEAEVNAVQNRDMADIEAQLTKKKNALEELPTEIERLDTDLKDLKEREKKRKEEREKRRKKRRRSFEESAGAGGGSTSKQQRRALQNLKL